jgi:hypothetical protein
MEVDVIRIMILFVVAILTTGCDNGPAKVQNAKPVDDGGPVEKPVAVNGPKPASTSDQAIGAIQRLLAVHTKNKPEALAAFRNCTVKRSGEMNQGGAMMPAESTDRFAWPGRFRSEVKLGTLPTIMFLVDGDRVQFYAPGAGHAKPEEQTGAEADNVLEDLRGTWMTLLTPLVEEKDYVAAIEPESPKDAVAIRVWVRDQPPCVLLVDAKSGLLQKVLFEKKADGRSETWAFAVSDYKEFAGVQLPTKVVYAAGRQAGATWTSVTYEPASAFPAGTFEKP